MVRNRPAHRLGIVVALFALLLVPTFAGAQCRPESSIADVSTILSVYAKRHSNGTTTLWYIHTLSHEVVCSGSFCDGSDEYVWRSSNSENVNVYSLVDVDSCGESMILTPGDPGDLAAVRIRIKFGENYHLHSPPAHFARHKTFTVKIDPAEITQCECVYQLNYDSGAGDFGQDATVFPSGCTAC